VGELREVEELGVEPPGALAVPRQLGGARRARDAVESPGVGAFRGLELDESLGGLTELEQQLANISRAAGWRPA